MAEAWISELTTLLGADHVRNDPGDAWSIDGVRPVVVAVPADAVQVAGVLRIATRERLVVVPWGGGTWQDVGNPPARVDVVLSTARIKGVLEHNPKDQTVRVAAGTTLAELQSALAGEGQVLPVDPPESDRSTLGGLVATGAWGPSRLGVGTMRDFLIGIDYVTGDGVAAKAGGKVVKNVAGYNLMQLHTGAFGQLGVVTAVNLKVRPLPKGVGAVRADVAGKVEAAVAALLSSDVRPQLIEVLAGPDAGRRELIVGFAEDTTAAADWQVGRARVLLADQVGAKAEPLAGKACTDALEGLRNGFRREALFQANLPGSEVAGFLDTAMAALRDSSRPLGWVLQASAGNGLVTGTPVNDAGEEMPSAGEVLKCETVAGVLRTLREKAVATGGSLVLRHAPARLKAMLPVWGAERPDWEFMRKLKAAFDPAGVLNPGRMV